jgi:hypothetical protein
MLFGTLHVSYTGNDSLNVGTINLVKTLGIINQIFKPTLSNSSDHGQYELMRISVSRKALQWDCGIHSFGL